MTDWNPGGASAAGPPITVKKMTYWQPLAEGACETCGEPMLFNLAINYLRHQDEALDAGHEPWPRPYQCGPNDAVDPDCTCPPCL